ncbi:hypothetical protein UlMin_044420 [Ulmus minor]
MEKMQSSIFVILLSSFMIGLGSVSAMIHIVGGSHGWRVPHNQTYFEEWAKPRTFGLGDRLVFPSRPCGNNVMRVSKEDFPKCSQNHVITMYYEGPTILILKELGDYYFYSGVGKHCEAGQKLHITVTNKSGSSGKLLPFELFNSTDAAAQPAAVVAAAAPPNATVHHSGATAIRNIGLVSASLLSFLFSLFI